MKIRLDFVTNSSSSSFVAVSIEDSELARICREHRIRLNVSGDMISCNIYIGEAELPIAPRGADFILWFLKFVTELNLADEAACKEIRSHRKEIEYSFIHSSIEYEHYCTEDFNGNLHWEESRDKERIILKGFDASKWSEVWEKESIEEISKLDTGTNTERLAPDNYPFWRFLSEGYASSTRDNFVRKMMDKYGTTVIEVGSLNNGSADDLTADDLLEKLNEKAALPEELDFEGKTVEISCYTNNSGNALFAYESDRYTQVNKDSIEEEIKWFKENTHQNLELIKKNLWINLIKESYEKAIKELKATPVNRISSSCDYVVVPRSLDEYISQDDVQSYMKEKYNLHDGSEDMLTLFTKEEHEMEKKELSISYYEKIIMGIESADKIRKMSKSKREPIKIIWEDQMHDFLIANTQFGNNVITKPTAHAETQIVNDGSQKLPVPEEYNNLLYRVRMTIHKAWPDGVINKKTKKFEQLQEDLTACYTGIGYSSEEAFFKAYGYSVKTGKRK